MARFCLLVTKSVVSTALSQFLGSISIGENSESKYFIYIQHNTLVRVDVKVTSLPQQLITYLLLRTALEVGIRW